METKQEARVFLWYYGIVFHISTSESMFCFGFGSSQNNWAVSSYWRIQHIIPHVIYGFTSLWEAHCALCLVFLDSGQASWLQMNLHLHPTTMIPLQYNLVPKEITSKLSSHFATLKISKYKYSNSINNNQVPVLMYKSTILK